MLISLRNCAFTVSQGSVHGSLILRETDSCCFDIFFFTSMTFASSGGAVLCQMMKHMNVVHDTHKFHLVQILHFSASVCLELTLYKMSEGQIAHRQSCSSSVHCHPDPNSGCYARYLPCWFLLHRGLIVTHKLEHPVHCHRAQQLVHQPKVWNVCEPLRWRELRPDSDAKSLSP